MSLSPCQLNFRNGGITFMYVTRCLLSDNFIYFIWVKGLQKKCFVAISMTLCKLLSIIHSHFIPLRWLCNHRIGSVTFLTNWPLGIEIFKTKDLHQCEIGAERILYDTIAGAYYFRTEFTWTITRLRYHIFFCYASGLDEIPKKT